MTEALGELRHFHDGANLLQPALCYSSNGNKRDAHTCHTSPEPPIAPTLSCCLSHERKSQAIEVLLLGVADDKCAGYHEGNKSTKKRKENSSKPQGAHLPLRAALHVDMYAALHRRLQRSLESHKGRHLLRRCRDSLPGGVESYLQELPNNGAQVSVNCVL